MKVDAGQAEGPRATFVNLYGLAGAAIVAPRYTTAGERNDETHAHFRNCWYGPGRASGRSETH